VDYSAWHGPRGSPGHGCRRPATTQSKTDPRS